MPRLRSFGEVENPGHDLKINPKRRRIDTSDDAPENSSDIESDDKDIDEEEVEVDYVDTQARTSPGR
jgi:hypothetical protein